MATGVEPNTKEKDKEREKQERKNRDKNLLRTMELHASALAAIDVRSGDF